MFMPRSLPVATTTELGRVFATIVLSLYTLISNTFGRDPGRVAIATPLRRYINNTVRRLDRLLARLAAGKLRPRRPRPDIPQADIPAGDTPQPARPRVRFPDKRAWIIAELGYHAAGFASQINYLLETHGQAPLIAASPQAHRLLRPLCRMLGIAPSCVPPLPKRPRKPRPKPEPKPKRLSYKQREALLWYPNIEGRPMKLLPPRAVLAREPPAYLPAALLPTAKKPA